MKPKCPACKQVSAKEGNKFFPFCSERCQLVDLGRWLNEEYRVPAEPVDPDEIDPHSAPRRGAARSGEAGPCDPEKREH